MQSTIALLRRASQVYRDGYHVTSTYWQSFKATLPPLPVNLWSVVVGMCLGDAGLTKPNATDAAMKVEQGYQQEAFVQHLFSLLRDWCFMVEVNDRAEPAGSVRDGQIKSFWFRTWGLPQLTLLWKLLYVDGVKTVPVGFVMEHVDAVALAYLVMCDGSTAGSVLILHTQGFGYEVNQTLSAELNARHGLNSTVVPHKKTMHVVKFPASDAPRLRELLAPHLIPSMEYKLPKLPK